MALVTTIAQVGSLAQGLLIAEGVAKKKKDKAGLMGLFRHLECIKPVYNKPLHILSEKTL